MRFHIVSLCTALGLAAATSAHGQSPAAPPPNYQQLANQVNALMARVATLQAQVTTLQGQVTTLEGNIFAADLIGTYSAVAIDVPLHGGSAPSVETDAFTATLTLNADGSSAFVAVTCRSSQLFVAGAWTSSDCSDPLPSLGTWSYANGVLTVTSDRFSAQFNVAVGGRLMTGAFASPHPLDPSSDNVLFILARLK